MAGSAARGWCRRRGRRGAASLPAAVAAWLTLLGAVGALAQAALLRELAATLGTADIALALILVAWLVGGACGALAVAVWGTGGSILRPGDSPQRPDRDPDAPLRGGGLEEAPEDPGPGAGPARVAWATSLAGAVGAVAALGAAGSVSRTAGLLEGQVCPLDVALAAGLGLAMPVAALLASAFAALARAAPARACLFETVGFGLGALAYRLVVGSGVPPSLPLGLVAFAMAAVAGVQPLMRKVHRWVAALVALVVLGGAFVPILAVARPGDVLAVRDEVAGRMTLTHRLGQLELHVDRWPEATAPAEEEAEETALLPRLLHREPRRILVIGDPLAVAVDRLLEPTTERIDWVEAIPGTSVALESEAGRGTNIWDERRAAPRRELERIATVARRSRVMVHRGDGRRWLARRPGGGDPHVLRRYDVALILVGAPLTGSRARFYTREALSMVRALLAPAGFAAFVLPASETHPGPGVLALQAAVLAAARDALGPPLLVTLGGRLLVVAGPGTPRRPDAAEVVARATQVGRAPRFLVRSRIERLLDPDETLSGLAYWSMHPAVGEPRAGGFEGHDALRDAIVATGAGAPASDDAPVCHRIGLLVALEAQAPGLARAFRILLDAVLVLGVTGSSAGLLIMTLLVVFARPPWRVAASLATSGLTAMGLEVLLLLRLEVAGGVLMGEVALLGAAYMAGATLGTGLGPRLPSRLWWGLDLGLAAILVLAAGLPFDPGRPAAALACAAAAVWAHGILAGAQLVVAVGHRAGARLGVGLAWAADLAGAAAGALAAPLVLGAALGFQGALISLAALKLGSAVTARRT